MFTPLRSLVLALLALVAGVVVFFLWSPDTGVSATAQGQPQASPSAVAAPVVIQFEDVHWSDPSTLDWLAATVPKALKLKDSDVRVLHGGMADVRQMDVISEFGLAESGVKLLLTGDMASEGINLHRQCHHLIQALIGAMARDAVDHELLLATIGIGLAYLGQHRAQ